MKSKLTVYLGDPVHNFVPSNDIWTVPLNICDIAAYAKSFYKDRIEFRLFKFPDLLLKAIDEAPPDVIGLSNYIWNSELSKYIMRYAKRKSGRMVTVMGGVNVTQTEEKMTRLMNDAHLDFYVSYYGEDPFKSIIGAILKDKYALTDLHKAPDINGVWYLDSVSKKAVEIPVKRNITDLDEIPSAYTTGIADDFLRAGLMPMLETDRGCPFGCTYCDWGAAGLGKLTKYSIERIKKDIEYCRQHSADERLMIDDANFGILGERDLEIAQYLRDLRQKTGYPDKLIVTWSQAKSETVLKVVDALKDMLMVTTSFQSMNAETLKNINRRNISHTDFWKIIEYCKKRKIDTYGELMLALPGETLESHFSAIRYLFDQGVDFININPLMLLEGASLATPGQRNKFGMRTKWRLLENCYGVYNSASVIESQEMVVRTDTMSEEEYLLCRPVSWLIQMSWNLRRHDILMRYVQSIGCNPLDFILKAIKEYRNAPKVVSNIFEDFFKDAQDELFDTREKLVDFYSQPEQMEKLRQGGFRKLNTHYSSRVSLECDKEFIEYYRDIAKALAREKGVGGAEEAINECSRFMYYRYISCDDLSHLSGQSADKRLSFKYGILEWTNNYDKPLSDFFRPDNVEYVFFLEQEQKNILLKHLKQFDGLSAEYQMRKLQEPYHGIHKKHLLYHIRKA